MKGCTTVDAWTQCEPTSAALSRQIRHRETLFISALPGLLAPQMAVMLPRNEALELLGPHVQEGSLESELKRLALLRKFMVDMLRLSKKFARLYTASNLHGPHVEYSYFLAADLP